MRDCQCQECLFCRQNIFIVSYVHFRQKEGDVTSPPVNPIQSQSLRGPRNNKFSQELNSQLRYLCEIVIVNVKNASLEKIFSKSHTFRQKEADKTSPLVTEVNSQSPRGTNSLRNNEISKVSSGAAIDDVSLDRKLFCDLP